MKFFFIRTTKQMEHSTKEFSDKISVVLDDQQRILYLQINNASKVLGCHLWKTDADIDLLSPLCLTYEYYPMDDILDIFLINTQHIKNVIDSTEEIDDEDNLSILATKDKHGLLIALQINEASKVLRYDEK
eukprot:Phypoly_transcript_27648.p1 GENE.Phypoly_transcript_27648~~Phypoly_transcript_27648.p1  ORF type:complete len:141 (+),score=21.75 Phypoly_transcript_27648:32-424(+)